MTLTELTRKFNTEVKARTFIEKMRWPDGVRCPRCGHDKISRLRKQRKFECAKCEYQFSVTAGTIFHKTRLPLRKWLIAIYLICQSKKGMSAHQIHRMLDISYPTAWYMGHRIRSAMTSTDDEAKLFGILEMDDTYIGGKEKGVGPGRPGARSKKSAVVGIIERGGRIRCTKVSHLNSDEIKAFA